MKQGATAVTSSSGEGAIVQYKEHLYELSYKNNDWSWEILPQKLSVDVYNAVMMTLPADYC